MKKASPLAKQIRQNRERAHRLTEARHDQNEKVIASLRKQGGRVA